MFINFSNHPSEGWDEAQLRTARELGGRVMDVAFPMVPPEADEAEVEALAEDYADRILALLGDSDDAEQPDAADSAMNASADEPGSCRSWECLGGKLRVEMSFGDNPADDDDECTDNVVHVMGELTLTHAVVSRLLNEGVRCVASTTRRDVTVQPDGSKVSRFHFVRFRDYEP